MYLKTLGHNLIWYKYSSSDNGWGSGMVSCNHISLPMLLIKAFVIMSGKNYKLLFYCCVFCSFLLSDCQINSLIFRFLNTRTYFSSGDTFLLDIISKKVNFKIAEKIIP